MTLSMAAINPAEFIQAMGQIPSFRGSISEK